MPPLTMGIRMKVSVGNILSVTEGVILQQVNAIGFMNSGVAKAIREKYPVVYDEYSKIVPQVLTNGARDGLMGRVILTNVAPQLVVANIVGQKTCHRYGDPDGVRYTSYDALDKAFTELASLLQGLPVSLHLPLIGSGLGGGHWQVVKALIEHRLREFDKTLWLMPGMVEPA